MNRRERRRQAKEARGAGKGGKAASHGIRGEQLAVEGKIDEAIKAFRRAISIDPHYADARNNLGVLLRRQGQLDEAVESYRQAAAIQPDHAETHYNLGNAFKELGRQEEALASYHKALAIRPDYAEAHANLGKALQELGRLEEAVASCHKALAIRPDFAEAHTNLGNALQELGRQEEAIASYHKALAIRPDFAEAHNNLGGVFRDTGRLEESVKSCRRAVELKPDFADAHRNLAMVLLQLGHLKEGWEEYEWRLHAESSKAPARAFPHPLWDGSPLAGKRIVLWGEQGIGDEVRVASMIPDLLEKWGDKAESIDIECDQRLVDLFTRSFEGITAHPRPYEGAERGTVDYDFQCPIASLGRFFRPAIESFPETASYLKADPEGAAFWRQRLGELGPGPKIGLCWRSLSMDKADTLHYATIESLAPIFALPGVEIVNLFYGECSDEIAEFKRRYGVTLRTWDDIDLKMDQEGVASLMANLDLVISQPGAVSDLTGSLGVPVFVFHAGGVYFWLGTGTDVWHPNSRCFGKELHAAWEPTFEDMAAAIREKLDLDA